MLIIVYNKSYKHLCNYTHQDMIDLKKVRVGLKISQLEMAQVLNCTQAYISQIENRRTALPPEFEETLKRKYGEAKIAKLDSSKILKTLGWRDASDPDYSELKKQLSTLINEIQQKTNYSIEDISRLVYRKNDTISYDLSRGQINPNMIKYILKHLEKLGLSPIDISMEKEASATGGEKFQLHFKNLKNFVAFILKNEIAKAETDLWLKGKEVDYFVNSSIDIIPKILSNDILGIKRTSIDEIQFGKLHLLVFKDGSYNTQYITQSNRSEFLNLSYQIPPASYIEIEKSSIYRLYCVITAIRKIDF